MSGLEIVGVVLGTIPLLVEGLKSYQHGLQTVSHMVRYEKTVEELVKQFNVIDLHYRSTCELLFRPLMLEEDELADMLKSPGQIKWNDAELASQLREHLGDDYQRYLEAVKLLDSQVVKFATKLGMDPEDNFKPKWLAEQASTQQSLREKFFRKSSKVWKGLKVGVENGELERALQKVKMTIDTLNDVLVTHERIAPARQERKRRGNVRVWRRIREAAKNVHAALAAHWQCPPDHRHTASLRLETRKVSQENDAFRFGLILAFDCSSSLSQPQLWHELEIEPQLQSTSPSQTKSPNSSVAAVPDIKVKFATAPAITVTRVQPPISVIAPSGSEIKDLCDWQQNQKSTSTERIGFIEHHLWHHHLFRSKPSKVLNQDLRLLSLRDCVNGSTTPSTPTSILARGLSTKEKYHIATILASSVLQLADTPWLPSSALDSEEVLVMDLDEHSTATVPYIRREFTTSSAKQAKPSTPLIENQLVFALGVVLIELAYRRPLSTFKQAGDMDAQGNDYPHTDLQVANRLVKGLESMEGKKYADAARDCVRCNFDCHDYSLDNENFQESFYTRVVQPLQVLKTGLE